MKAPTPQAQSINQVFDNNYVIPRYQRKYTWKLEQCQRLWDDLLNFYEDWPQKARKKEVYFLGNMIVNKTAGNKPDEVIDGQQRLITLSLLIKAFWDFFNRFENNSKERSEMKQEIAEIERCLFIPDEATREISQRSKLKVRLRSEVIEENNEDLERMLTANYEEIKEEVESVSKKKKESMMKNYGFFCKTCKQLGKGWQERHIPLW